MPPHPQVEDMYLSFPRRRERVKARGQGARLGQPLGALGSEHPTLDFNVLLSPL